ncbi:MAG: SGNH/GDSL hydrolase family protein [Actinomycetota bacterium]|nr:GDSL-type esterase/lipase family protein [Actinomycetota bacterium]
MDPAPFLRGVAFPGTKSVPYPRANPQDAARLPLDTWAMAQVPAGVRLEFATDADEVEIVYETKTDDLGSRGDGAGRTFALWRFLQPVSEDKAVLGEGRARLACGETSEHRCIVYLPEGMKPRIAGIEVFGGTITPATPRKRWIAYGDSIAEGWIASAPAMSWTAITARTHALDLINMGYAGAARGEVPSAEQIAGLPAEVISITHGTNCWNRTPNSVGMMREGLVAFLDIVRHGHPATPILVASPVIRPDAEDVKNKLGATLDDLRFTMEDVVEERIKAGDENLYLARGLELMGASMLGDDVHPNDEGHQSIAAALGPILHDIGGAD